MTDTLVAALKALDVVRTGYVVRNLDGTAMRDAQTSHATYRICRRAGLPERGWHVLRHSFGTHAARLRINPWMLMAWMGHKRIDETMGYVHVAERSPRAIPEEIVRAAENKTDPGTRVLAMLGARDKNRGGWDRFYCYVGGLGGAGEGIRTLDVNLGNVPKGQRRRRVRGDRSAGRSRAKGHGGEQVGNG